MEIKIADIEAIGAFAALAQPTRLEVFRLLVAAEPEGLPAGDIARACAAPHNTMSAHLAVLARAGLVRSERRGRSIVYRASVERAQELTRFLLEDCCNGRPDLCAAPNETKGDVPACAPEATRQAAREKMS